MNIGSKEHYEILENFEKQFSQYNLTREENKDLWKKGYVYANGETNKLYQGFLSGYAFARCIYFQNN